MVSIKKVAALIATGLITGTVYLGVRSGKDNRFSEQNYTPEAIRVLELARDQAEQFGQSRITSNFLLLGILTGV